MIEEGYLLIYSCSNKFGWLNDSISGFFFFFFKFDLSIVCKNIGFFICFGSLF